MKENMILISLWLSHKIICGSLFVKLIGIPALLIHRLIVEWLFCVEISWHTKIGNNLKLFHPFGIVIHRGCVIGDHCTIRQNTTIGTKVDQAGKESMAPRLGNNVDVGAGVNIIGDVVIGDNVVIGAGSVVVHNVANNSIVAGNPAKLIKTLS